MVTFFSTITTAAHTYLPIRALQAPGSHPLGPMAWKGIRPNAVIGRVIPLLLLSYVVSTYHLVVVDYLCEQVQDPSAACNVAV